MNNSLKTKLFLNETIYLISIFIFSLFIASVVSKKLDGLQKTEFFIELENASHVSSDNQKVFFSINQYKSTHLLNSYYLKEKEINEHILKAFIMPVDKSLLKVNLYNYTSSDTEFILNQSINFLKKSMPFTITDNQSNLINHNMTQIKEPGALITPIQVNYWLIVVAFFSVLYFITLIIKNLYAEK